MKKIVLSLLGIYFLALVVYWVWLIPSFVDQRTSEKIRLGMSGHQVAQVLGIFEPMETKINAYCSPMSDASFTRIALYDAGSVPLLPLPMVYATSTTFCFDSQNRLVAFRTRRWFDGP
jgi:hypothetical protein